MWITLRRLFKEIDHVEEAWVFLPKSEPWSLGTEALVSQTEEVPAEQELEDKAGYPPAAKERNLMAALPVTVVQDIIFNAKAQKPELTEEEMLEAFLFYYDNDAFLEF